MKFFSEFRTKWNRRPWPSSVAELRALRVSYSQFGEDLLATTLVGYEKNNGVYIDIGCFHPVQLSNTWIFYRRGWRGLCVDPSPDAARLWPLLRPGDVFVQAAIAEVKGTLFYATSRRYPACNRLMEQPISVGDPTFDSSAEVPVAPIADIVREHNFDASNVDLMSIDCEGFDIQVLRSYDFLRSRPRVLIVEDHDPSLDSDLVRYCRKLDYRLVCATHLSRIFVDVSNC